MSTFDQDRQDMVDCPVQVHAIPVKALAACRTLQSAATRRGADPPKGRRPQVLAAVWCPEARLAETSMRESPQECSAHTVAQLAGQSFHGTLPVVVREHSGAARARQALALDRVRC